MRPRFRLASAIVALMAVILVAAPVAAASPWVVLKQSGTSAYAFSGGECPENTDGTVTCEGNHIDVFNGTTRQSGEPTRKGERACYGEFSYTFDPTTGEITEYNALFGCTIDAGTLRINKLTSITLASTVIELTAIECDASACTESPAGSTTVSGTWTGVGAISTNTGKYSFADGNCVQRHADRGSFRAASFEGSIDATDAAMGVGSFTFRTTCPF